MAKPKAKKEEPSAAFVIELKLGGKTYTSSGASCFEALRGLERPEKIMGKVFLKLTHGPFKKDLLLSPIQAKRLFYNPTMQQIQAKYLAMGLK